ncbi:MAG: spermidine/putrescine ABC transporter substrate-binding protein [Actinomycetales bacterium]|nr:spermidine/putrescine ABC transporter substrate-binding protein [Actinomycetales bacterium]
MTRRQRPISPEAAAVVRAQRMLSRRSVLGAAGALGAGAFLGGCGTGGAGDDDKPEPAKDRSETERIVNWVNWPLYLDYDEKNKTYPTLEKFQQQTGIKATYTEDIEDNDAYYGKVSGQLKNGQDIGKDVIVFTDWMVARCMRQGYLQQLDKKNIANAKNMLDPLQKVTYDPGRQFSMTWQSGYAGLAWNKKAIADLGLQIRNVDDLWHPKLKGLVSVLAEMRDSLGLILMSQNVNISEKFGSAEFDRALDVIKTNLDSGQIRRVVGNSYMEDFTAGDVIACFAWSGDIFMANGEAGRDLYGFTLPESGAPLWSDNMVVPIGSPHKKNAEILMNYYYDPVVAAEAAAYINYICPVKGAKEEMLKIDPSLAESPLIFPTDEDLKKVQVFRATDAQEEEEFSSKFQKVLGN